MTKDFSNYSNIGVGVTKEKYKSHTSSTTSRKVTRASAYLKTTSFPTLTKNARLRFLTGTPQLWQTKTTYGKSRISSRLGLAIPTSRLVSVSNHHVSAPPLLNKQLYE